MGGAAERPLSRPSFIGAGRDLNCYGKINRLGSEAPCGVTCLVLHSELELALAGIGRSAEPRRDQYLNLAFVDGDGPILPADFQLLRLRILDVRVLEWECRFELQGRGGQLGLRRGIGID